MSTNLNWEDFSINRINTLVKLSPKHLHANDGENKPEDEAHKQHIEDGRDGIHKCIHHNLLSAGGKNYNEFSFLRKGNIHILPICVSIYVTDMGSLTT